MFDLGRQIDEEDYKKQCGPGPILEMIAQRGGRSYLTIEIWMNNTTLWRQIINIILLWGQTQRTILFSLGKLYKYKD